MRWESLARRRRVLRRSAIVVWSFGAAALTAGIRVAAILWSTPWVAAAALTTVAANAVATALWRVADDSYAIRRFPDRWLSEQERLSEQEGAEPDERSHEDG
jgi:hypothetical protein